jgi:hypothetical protein
MPGSFSKWLGFSFFRFDRDLHRFSKISSEIMNCGISGCIKKCLNNETLFLTTAVSEYQLITYSGPTTESLNKPAFCEYAKGIGNGGAGKACVFDNKTSL